MDGAKRSGLYANRFVVERLENRLLLSADPSVTTIQPMSGASGVDRDAAVTADFYFPSGPLNSATVTTGTVVLYRTSDHSVVPAIVNTTGGDDAVILQPSVLLDPNTSYTFQITSGVQDVTGAPVVPYTMTFTTGTGGATVDPSVAFQQIALPTAQGVPFTTVRIGPDHALWAGAEDGRIFRFPINGDGTLGTPQIITTLQTYEGGPRLLTGFAFDPASTASDPILWVADSAYTFTNAPDFSSKITRMSGPGLTDVQDVVINLPRSVTDHTTDQPVFGPDGALYFCQAAENSMGAPDIVWGNRSEHLLSAAILRLDTTAALALGAPLNALTPDVGGTYNPNAPGAPLTIYATGVRNAFDLLWTSSGNLLAPVNGASSGGNTPAGPDVPGLTSVPQVESDYLYNIIPGGYYGHPDPVRGQYVLDGGNPTAGVDPAEVTDYPVGTQPDPSYQFPVFDFGLHRSPDGIIQYTGNAFNGALNGDILVAEYSAGDDIIALTPGPNGTISSAQRDITGLSGFDNPVNLVEDPTTGFLYVAELGGQRITLLVPVSPHPAATLSATVLAFNSVATGNSGAGPSRTETITIGNDGTVPLDLSDIQIVNNPSSPTQDASAFTITGTAPGTVAPGGSAELNLVYRAGLVGMQSALLQIQTNDPNQPTLTVQLNGIGTAGQYGYLEPSLVQILRANDIPTIVGAGPNDANINNSQYPETPDPSSQEVVMPRLVKAGAGPVTITPLASFDADAAPALRLGYYTPGDPTDQTELFTITQADDQTVNPSAQGATSFDPGSAPFSLYAVYPGVTTPNGQPDIHYSEDEFNVLDPADPRKFRFFPLENPDGSIVPNAYVVAAEDYNSSTYNSFTNFVGIIRNVMPAPDAVGAPVLGLTNLEGAPSSTRMVFNRIQNPNPADPSGFTDQVNDQATLQINNSGDEPLVISALTLSDTTNWALENPPTLPASIAPGGTLDVTVQFIATTCPPQSVNQTDSSQTANGIPVDQAGGVWNGRLTITSNDPVNPIRTVQLAGYWQNTSENGNEPSLQTIVNLIYGYDTTLSSAQQPDLPNNGTSAVLYGQEVASGLWQAADPTQPVQVQQLAAFHSQFDPTTGQETSANVGWYLQSSPSDTIPLFQDEPGAAQSLLPTINGSTTAPAGGSFSPSGTFGWILDGENSQDALNTTDIDTYGRSGHALRFYPVRTAAGNPVPNTWLVAMDYENGPTDSSSYDGLVLLVRNMRPAASPPAPTDLAASGPSGGGVLLEWAAASDSDPVGYNIYRSASASGPYVKINPAAVSGSQYADLTAPVGQTSYYEVFAVDLTTGAQSPASDAAAAAISDVTATTNLPAPSMLTATAASTSSITLNWVPSPGAADYHIERLGPDDTQFVEIASGITGNSFTDTGLTPGATYQYRVRAENSSGFSSYSTVAQATTDADPAPAPTPAPIPVNDNFGTIVRGSRRVRATLTPTAGSQIFEFTLTGYSKVTIHMQGMKVNADLELLDANGDVIAGSHHPKRRAESITIKLNAGTYYIESYLVDQAPTPFVTSFSIQPIKVKTPKAKPVKKALAALLMDRLR